ncbi:hypothetical protein DL770_001579 [Monosporascus sp. CRB-9-2]|nr:hypothetical protein DL770_001579 [Monosporascus sp. CRB-9-2]
MEPVFVIQRQRKFHRRSKRGCIICSYCLKHGAECRYSDSDVSPSPIGTPQHTDPGSDAGEPSASLLDPSPKDPFTGTSFKLPDRLQTIRFVNEQIKDPVTATHDGTVAAVATLALVEWHLIFVGWPRSSSFKGQAARTVTRRSAWDIVKINRTDSVHQSLVISLLQATVRPIYSLFTLSSSSDWGESLPEVLAKKIPRSKEEDSNIVTPLRPVDCTRTGFMACYFYLHVILREERVDSFILNWLIEQLLIDVRRTELLMQKGQYSQSLWFWSVLFGACIATAAKTDSSLEEAQMKLARDEYLGKINMASQVLRIKTWEGAKAALRLFAWEDEFDGELELKAIWEESVWADQGRAKMPGAGNVDSGDVRAFW